MKIGRNNQVAPKMGPQRPQVFQVRDLIDRLFVCLLSGNKKLTCLSLHDFEPWKENEQLSDSCVSHLPAVDAVYVPESRLTACLEPNGSIFLYSGVTKVRDHFAYMHSSTLNTKCSISDMHTWGDSCLGIHIAVVSGITFR